MQNCVQETLRNPSRLADPMKVTEAMNWIKDVAKVDTSSTLEA